MLLVRHWQTYANKSGLVSWRYNTRLTLEWINQAKKLAESEDLKEVTQIVSSPLFRCKKTSAILSSWLGDIPIYYESLLLEKDMWIYNWVSRKKIRKKMGIKPWVNPFYFLEDDESVENEINLINRAILFLKKYKNNHAKTLFVSHAWMINVIYNVFKSKTPLHMKVKYNTIKNCEVMKLTWI